MPILETQFNTSHCRRVVAAWQAVRQSGERALYHMRIPVQKMPSLPAMLKVRDPYKVYWQNRTGDVETVGLGATDMLCAKQPEETPGIFDQIEHRLASSETDVRFYGGMAFDADRPLTSLWAQLGVCRFWVPQIEWRRCGRDVVLHITTSSLTDQTLESVLNKVIASAQTASFPAENRIQRETRCPTRDQWQQRVTGLVEELKSSPGKAVLSVQDIVEMSEAIDSVSLWERLNAKVSAAYRFYVATQDTVFLGASPECLYRRDGSRIESEALAGTGASRQPGVLMSSNKDNQEHDFVVRDMVEALEHICTGVRRAEHKESLIWQDLVHLRTRLTGHLKPDCRDRDILAALHPSAAVLGYPRDKARQWLHTYEDPERGWYAGPVGWIGKEQSEFAVAIRSAMIRENRIALSAGAGIIRESDPEAEWEEVRSKMNLYREIMALDKL